MSFSRILAVVAVGTLIVFASLSVYSATKPAAGASGVRNAPYEQRYGEWTTGSNMSALDPKLDKRDRVNANNKSALDPKLDLRDRGVVPTKTPAFAHGEWMIKVR